ncbi:unnamed protein product [Phyllotreta striolata]|uniref:Uncharacterized protein n=1 Tax=Phyllotreta striolata TaxID=444603 RepID=A0A9P0DFE7_PHYSR|nr:unnamed protein product [Phyllotreta striolata]
MSSNPKQNAAGGPQTQRYTSSPCYQPMQPVTGSEYDFFRGPEGYPVSTPPGPYAPPPPNQGGNQAPALRGPSGPPNQSSTPPNAADLKVPQIPQQASITSMYTAVRPTAGSYYPRTAGPPNQPTRMANPNTRPQQPALFTPAAPQFMHVAPQVYISSNSVPYAFNQRPSTGFAQLPIYQHIAYPYGTAPTQTQSTVSYNYYPASMMQRATGTIPQAPVANPNSQNQMPSVPIVTNNHHQQTFPRQQQHKRRSNAIPIIDPDTGADRLQELFEDNSHPPSGESSARQTPQPSAATQSHNKEVQATFAKQVLQALNKDTTSADQQPQQQQQHHHSFVPPAPPKDEHHSEHHTDNAGGVHPANHVVHEQAYVMGQVHQVQQQQPQHPQINREVVQTSKLQAEAKEFVLTAKETPIVSANIEAVEVTLPNKLPKDRESPAKGRKQRIGDHKDSNKDVAAVTAVSKEVLVDNKEPSSTKDEAKPIHETSPSPTIAPSNTTQVAAVSKEAVAPAKEATAPLQDKHRSSHHQHPQQQPQHPQQQPQHPQQQQQQQQQHRKDSKEKQPLERQDSSGSTNAAAAAAAAQEAKSKQNAQRSSSKQGSGGVNANTKSLPTPVQVPPPQPAKPASKSNKKNELNLKGANKEGTDMDAFNDNSLREEVNSNVIPTQVVNNSDIINANSLPPTANNAVPSHTSEVNAKTEASNKKFDNNVAVKPAEIVTKTTKNKIDITDIVKEKPKNIKPFTSMIGQDEIDRAAMTQSNEKIVQAKNDVNAKTSEISRIENKLPYTDGQWSPANQNGIKKYQKDFLIALRDTPASRAAPDNLPDFVLADDRGRLGDGRLSMGGSRIDFNPSFNTYGRNSSQKGPISGRSSASKMDRNKGGKGSTAKPTIKLSLSVKEEVKLHESENAWKPARFTKGECATDEDKKTEELYRNVRGILNKLTPQKFDTLLQQVRNLSIDTTERLQGVIDLVFEKAVDEPNFSVAYASMCGHLALIQVPKSTSGKDKDDKEEFVNFRKLLITRCQQEFEKQSVDESFKEQKLKEIEECTDPDKRKDIEFDFEEHLRRVRMKSVGNIRFIGELFKQQMLTQKIMLRCLNNLLDNGDEESLECLCKLLTTIGKELESKGIHLEDIFNKMKNLADRRQGTKISSRIRFMLQDVIDLRNSKWVPRRQDLNPKMIDQIQKEAEQEQMNIQMMNSVPMTPRKDERGGGGGGGSGSQSSVNDRKGGRGRITDDGGWTMMKSSKPSGFSVQSDKLKAGKAPTADEPLGHSGQFRHWLAGSNVKPAALQVPNTANMFTALENIESDKRFNSRSGQKDPYYSKGTSLERGSYKYDSRSGSRSGSQHRSNDSSASSSQRGTPAPAPPVVQQPPHNVAQQPAAQRVPPTAVAPSISSAPVQIENLTDDQRYRRITNNLDEYVNGNCTLEEYFTDISCAVSPSQFSRMVNDSILHILEKSQDTRLKTGSLFAKLILQGKISLDDYCTGLEELFWQADDLKIDIPKIWDYLAEILVDSIIEEALPLKSLHKTASVLIKQKQCDKLLVSLFKLVISNKGTNCLQTLWQLSHLQVSDFMDASQVDAFIKDNQFQLLLGGATPGSQMQLSYDEIQTKLLNFLRNNRNIDDICDWVLANVGEAGVNETKFIRALATAIFEDSINKNLKLAPERLEQHTNLLLKYVDNNPGFELECLYALQALIHKMEHPQGLLLTICDKLYELGTFSQESFVSWEQSKDPAEQEGKGVALMQLTSFFCQLKENDEDDVDDDASSGSEQDTEE